MELNYWFVIVNWHLCHSKRQILIVQSEAIVAALKFAVIAFEGSGSIEMSILGLVRCEALSSGRR